MSNNVCEFVGPALATALVLGVGAGEAFAVDAATFLISAALLVRMSPRRREAAAGADVAGGEEPASLRAQLRIGYEEVRARAWVWATLHRRLRAAVLRPRPVVRPRAGASPRSNYGGTDVYGIVAAALGAGTIVGSLAGIRWRPARPMRLGLVMGALWCPMAVAYALGAPLEVVSARGRRRRLRLRPVRRLVADRARRADPAGPALAGQLLRLDGLARPAAGRLSARRAARRRARRGRGARRRLRAGDDRLAARAAAPRNAGRSSGHPRASGRDEPTTGEHRIGFPDV